MPWRTSWRAGLISTPRWRRCWRGRSSARPADRQRCWTRRRAPRTIPRRRRKMRLDLSRVGQIAISVADVDRAEAFYETALGLRKLYRFGDLVFFACAGLRLMIGKAENPAD